MSAFFGMLTITILALIAGVALGYAIAIYDRDN
jgi:hypothetical protein